MGLQNALNVFIEETFTKSFIYSQDGNIFTTIRESEEIEFKKSFQKDRSSINKPYLKTIAGMANNKGGVMIFGICPDTHQLIGISKENEEFDNKDISSTLNNSFTGSIEAFYKTHRFGGVVIGFLIIFEAKEKPVISNNNITNDFVEGDIYYRYPAQSRKIKALDLSRIIKQEIEKKTSLFLKNINQLAKIGVENGAILDTLTGEIHAENQNVKLILDENILNELNLIPEANIVSNNGAPAYIIKGNIYPETTTIVEKFVPKTLTVTDIYRSFLSRECHNPKDFIKHLLYQNTHYFPIYFFINKAEINVQQAISLIDEQKDTDIKKNTKKLLKGKLQQNSIEKSIGSFLEIDLEKLELDLEDDIEKKITELKAKYHLRKNQDSSLYRYIIYSKISNSEKISDYFLTNRLTEVIEAITHLSSNIILSAQEYLMNLVNDILNKLNEEEESENLAKSEFKKMLCFLDQVLYNEKYE